MQPGRRPPGDVTLVFHGYLLSGTGSNVYNAALAEALAAAGHDVHLFSQEREPEAFAWVDAVGDWDGGALRVRDVRAPAPGRGRVTVYRPDLGGLLPVYVADVYAGILARPFLELSDAEVEAYVARNVAAVREVADAVRPDAALANHLVMGPAILARALGATVPYAVKVHGSALEYVVKRDPRFEPWAREGLAPARGVLVGSRHTAESLWAAMEDPTLPPRTRLGPPGVDVERFAPRDPAAARAGLEALVARLRAQETGAPGDAADSSFARRPGEAAAALASVGPDDELVVFVGKLIASKGVELLLAAWPLVRARRPRARLVVIGFGAFRAGLEALAARLAAGDLEGAAAVADEAGRPLPHLRTFLDGLGGAAERAYVAAAQDAEGSVAWAGRLDHDELADVLPAAAAMVVPSTFPEAFGMVSAEAAACGALPVVARHSGLGEVAAVLAEAVPAPAREWLAFDLGPEAVPTLAARLGDWLAAAEPLRAEVRAAIVEVTRERYGWAGVARTVLAAARGELAAIRPPDQ